MEKEKINNLLKDIQLISRRGRNPELSKEEVAVPYNIFTGKIREGAPT